MSVETTDSRTPAYVGAGTMGPFAIDYYFLEDDDLLVIKTEIATGVETILALAADYTVIGAGDPNGGSFTLTANLPATHAVQAIRDPDKLQTAQYPRNDKFPADSHQRVVDKLTMLVQRVYDKIARTLQISDGDVTGIDTTLPTPVASSVLGVNAAKTAFEWVLQAGVLAVSAFGQTLLNAVDYIAARKLIGLNADALWCGNAGGTANAITLTPDPAIAAYLAGQSFVFKAAATNNAATTIAVSGLAAKNAQFDGNAMTGGEVVNGKWFRATYDGANFQVERLMTLKSPTPDGAVLTADSTASGGVAWKITGFTTGDVKLTIKTAADTGWVLFNDLSIGSAASGATGRANADTQALYTLLWGNTADAQCPVATGRGANAAADFAANKAMTLPKALGRTLAIYGSGSGLTARVLAQILGEENHPLTAGEGPSHGHNLNAGGTGSGILVSAGGGTGFVGGATGAAVGSGTATADSTGSGTAHNTMQPTLFINAMIKL